MRVSMSIVGSATLVLIFIGRPVGSQTIVPVGVQGQVNTYTINSQMGPAVGYDGNGNFVVVWQSEGSRGTDTSDESIQGRAFNSNGVPAGLETQVNSYTTDRQRLPEVAVRDDGNFVVVWASQGSSGNDDWYHSIQGQRYGPDGQRIGGEFQVNTYTTADQTRPAVAIDSEGAFVVVWQSYGSSGNDDSYHSIQGQRFDSDGSPVGGEFQVNTYTTASQLSPAVGMDAAGAFVVVWESFGSYGSDTSTSIQGRIYNSNGVPVSPEAQVNTYTTLDQRSPEVAVRGDGSFVVVWQSYGSGGGDDSSYSIQGRIYNSNGVAVGPEAQVNTYTTGEQRFPDVAADGEENFLVVWRSLGSSGNDDSGTSIQGRLYASNGVAVGPDFQINTYTSADQRLPSVEIDASGNGVVVWDSFGSSGSDTSLFIIQGQRFAIPIFADGFESGDTSAWTSTVP